LDRTAEGFAKGERIAKLMTYMLVSIGIVEIIVGEITSSVGLTADGVHSIADAGISGIIWFGLRMSRRAPDKKFHFGYYKVESLAALFASIAMVGVSVLIIYFAYQKLIVPVELSYPLFALATLLGAGSISIFMAFNMRRIAKEYGLLSLRTGASNSIKDGSASFIVFFSVLTAYLGFYFMDAVGALIVAGYIIAISYVAIKEASLVLADVCHRPELVEEIRHIVEKNRMARMAEIKLRQAGPRVLGVVTILAPKEMTLLEADRLANQIEQDIQSSVDGVSFSAISVRPNPEE